MKSKSIRKEEAIARQKEHDKLTIEQKITRLDEKYGKGLGAKKERAKLKFKQDIKESRSSGKPEKVEKWNDYRISLFI